MNQFYTNTKNGKDRNLAASHSGSGGFAPPDVQYRNLVEENELLRKEIQVARKAGEITASLVVKQFEETEKILHRLQVANALRKAVLNSAAQISIIATNREGLITVFNTGAENLLGYRSEEIIGKKTPELFHLAAELEAVSQKLNLGIGQKIQWLDVFFEYAMRSQPDKLELTYVRKDESQFPIEMTINGLVGPEGDINGVLCIAMDIAEKKRSEKALMESERKYRLLIRNLPNCVYKGYLDGTIDFFDDKIEQITGYSKEEFLSRRKTWYDLVYHEDRQYAKEKLKQALRTDNSYIREYRFLSKNGDIIWVQDGGQIIYGENGEIEFITGAFLDITERKLAEKALHESEEKYRSIFNSGPNPIFVLDRTTLEILDANPMAEETYGYAKEEMRGRSFSFLGPVDDINTRLGEFDQDDWPEACVVGSKVQHYKKGNIPFYVRVTACPIRYKERDAVILATTDLTEMLEKEAQLLQASKMTTLGEMSAGIAHELNQPLNVINMGSDYLTMMVENHKKIAEDDLIEVATQISGQVNRAVEIIDRLREFGRKPDFAKKKVGLNRAVRVIYGIVNQQLALQNIKLKLDLAENLPPIMAHNTRIEQVIFNLVTNARDAINQKRETGFATEDHAITIRSFTENDWAAVMVTDTGTGIPADVRNKVFEPFFTTKEVGRGMGLGLSITYGIVRDYNGQIEIQSKEGVGSSIRLTFPGIFA
jgi:PAS domain S-box-containing protein